MEGRGDGWWPEEPEPKPDRGRKRKPTSRAPRGLASRSRPRVASRYSLLVGLVFAALVVIAVLNAIQTDEGGVAGIDPAADRGRALPEFAAVQLPPPPGAEAVDDDDAGADANIAQDDCESGRNPCPDDQVRVPACQVEGAGVIRVCDSFDRPLAISFWFTRGGDCLPSQDAFDEVAAARSDVANFLSVNVLDDAERVTEIVRGSGWEVPVAHDADGAVSNLYRIGICPTIVLAYPGGILHGAETKPGNFEVAEIESMVDELVEASAARERQG